MNAGPMDLFLIVVVVYPEITIEQEFTNTLHDRSSKDFKDLETKLCDAVSIFSLYC